MAGKLALGDPAAIPIPQVVGRCECQGAVVIRGGLVQAAGFGMNAGATGEQQPARRALRVGRRVIVGPAGRPLVGLCEFREAPARWADSAKAL